MAVTAAIVAASAIALFAWQNLREDDLPVDIAFGNGRLEATEVDITTKLPGRLDEVLVREGDSVSAGQVLAKVDVRELEAELRQAQAQVRQAEQQRNAAEAVIAQRESELVLAEKNLARQATSKSRILVALTTSAEAQPRKANT